MTDSPKPAGITPNLETAHPDWLLRVLVSISAAGLSVPITLQVHGALVSGVLTTGRKYFEQLGDTLAAAALPSDDEAQQSARNAIRKTFTSIAKEIYPDQMVEDEVRGILPATQYIHLEQALIYSESGQAVGQSSGTLWRGSLKSIDGFVFGKLQLD